MRITQSIIARNLLQSINRNRENMNALQTAIATGKEVRHSSNDPGRFTRAAQFRKTIVRNEQYLKNIADGQGWINETSALLDELYSRTMDAKEIAIQGADATSSTDTRSVLANEINNIIEEVVSLANSTYLGKNVFAGTKTREDEPFSYDGSGVTYNGNSGSITRRIAENLTVTVNVNGTQLVDSNMFSALIDLRDALSSDDTDAIQSSIDTVGSVSGELLSLSSAVGSIKNQLLATEQRLETAKMNLRSYLSQMEDADLAEAITKYNAEEMAYRAALQTTTDAIQLNLLDFLK